MIWERVISKIKLITFLKHSQPKAEAPGGHIFGLDKQHLPKRRTQSLCCSSVHGSLIEDRIRIHRWFFERKEPMTKSAKETHDSDALWIRVSDTTQYPVLVQKNAAENVSKYVGQHGARTIVVSDENVARIHGKRVMALLSPEVPVHLISFPPGEASKNRQTKEQLEDACFENSLGRDGVVVGLGGGVTLDLAGFVAATFMRGIPWIGIPTSLLAAVDASIGGKVGVDVPHGKNLVGNFHHPKAVCIDPTLISTLPKVEFKNGLAEMVKHAFIADATYLEKLLELENDPSLWKPDTLVRVIKRSVEIKATVVQNDPTEQNLRQILNFGHTIGHAIEKLSHYKIAHGLAVSIGMVLEAELAHATGLLAKEQVTQMCAALNKLDLPTALPSNTDPEAIIRVMRSDKKAREKQIRYVFPSRIGRMAKGLDGYGHAVADKLVLKVLKGALH